VTDAPEQLRIYVDFNNREEFDTVIISVGPTATGLAAEPSTLRVSATVILESEDLEATGVLRRSRYNPERWVADIIPGSYRNLPESEWDRFRK
jgi:hypothetical protein